ncbi:flagellar M-ring protein FliF [Palleronia aestuarii]|uniref:Flagellar M-ring protein n=1 Tax=Palleronia aestuarii TaxID=568105 RepID=A0A2W7PZY6_9RHOB|nr:flagellar basal-body MS-ring/collar protein FliF [Palleronia aestuarii]PZX15089.1 flagellar M-ring protein FliF [Palleronia aestuarii]
MQQFSTVWSNLSMQKRVIAGLATIAMFVAIIGVARMATQPSMELLFAGLENNSAGEVVQALEARGVAYEVRGNSIFVDGTQRDQLRLTLASEGLPSNPMQGYELLDQMSGFGTTSQMFDAAYWRAKEGELARTIVASPAIQNARVHISNPGTRPFQRDMKLTASVTITPTAGGLSSNHARALRYMVASAVTGLSPEDVSVIDANGGVILSAEEQGQATGDSTQRAEALKRNVERLLEARVGYGKAVVEVNVETVSEREEITERRIDPESRVAISTDTVETSESATDTGGNDVTVASNLPDGDAAGGNQSSESQSSETRQRTNYEVSETQRQVLRNPGAIDRITTAVLVDGIRNVAEDGTVTWEPRPEAEMAALRDLVSAAVGLNQDRGDTLSIQTMQFEPLVAEGSDPSAAIGSFANIDAMRLAQIGILGLVALAIGLFVVRPILGGKALPAPGRPGLAPPASEGSGLVGEIDPEDATEGMFGAPQFGLPMLADHDGADPDPNDAGSAVARLRSLIDERQEESLQILKSWMEDEGEKA